MTRATRKLRSIVIEPADEGRLETTIGDILDDPALLAFTLKVCGEAIEAPDTPEKRRYGARLLREILQAATTSFA